MSIPLVYQKKEIKNIERELRDIVEEKASRKINIQLINREIESMGVQINRILQCWKDSEKEKVQMRDEFNSSVANMSHDLRTPLTSIKGYMQFITGGELSDREREEYQEVCMERINYLQKLLDDFYQLSLIDLHDKKPNLQKVNLSQQLRECMLGKYTSFIDAGIEPEITIEEDVFIVGDLGYTERIIENILANAIKYSKGEISISLKKGRNVKLQISNTVQGMKKEETEKIFNKFYMVDKSRTDKGTGLGLAIAKGLVEKIHGNIEAELEENIFSIKVEFKALEV